uniref:Cyclic nucleotide-binding domain-containing protein n=1 Tax=Amphora coffeiformis TaxID=265554 RepID=A0A7S3P4I9_9STRA|eukprot:scaffold1634_cov137-Amphora_coffeaeformis.AAC.12
MTTTEQEQHAFNLLKESTWFQEASDGLVQRLAACMKPLAVKNGQILIEEGQTLSDILVLEQGQLLRTKYAANHPNDVSESLQHLRSVADNERLDYVLANSVVVDKLEQRGRVTGLLHAIRPEDESNNTSFATVIAVGDNMKVWILSGDDFRNVLAESPEYSMEIMAAMATELRSGTKSLRGLMEAAQQKKKTERSDSMDSNVTTCKVLCYDATQWTTTGFEGAVKEYNKQHKDKVYIDMHFTNERLSEQTASFAAGYDAVSLFVNDNASAQVLQTLSLLGVRMIAMRCAGFDRVDTQAAKAYDMTVARVPAYSPYAVAEHAVALLMTLNRKIHHASNRVRMANFTLDAGLMGMDIHGKTVGIMGTGKIGQIMCDIMLGFGVTLLCYDPYENQDVKDKGGKYVSLDEIYAQSDILMLAMPLMKPTYHTINDDMLSKLKPGVLLINTSRGGLVDTKALLKGLKSGIIGGVGMDVYEHEQDYFFQDWSAKHIKDEDLMHLLGNNNVVLTAHQAFFTQEAVTQIVQTTLNNLRDFSTGQTGLAHPNNCIPTTGK